MHRVLIAIALTGLSPTSVLAETLPHTVLIMDQSGPGVIAFDQITRSFRSRLDGGTQAAPTIYHEKLDLNVFSDAAYLRLLEDFVHEKYRNREIGVIFAVGAKGLQWAISFRDRRRADIPIVFAGISNQAVQASELPRNVTGRTIEHSFEDYVRTARVVVPDLRELVLVGDPLEQQGYRRHMKQEILAGAGGVDIVDLTGLPVRTVKERVAGLPASSVIVYTAIYLDDGKVITPREGLDMIAATANRPIVVDVEPYVGMGAAGGIVLRPEIVGREAAELVMRVLEEDTAAEIPVTASNAMQAVFSWPDLRKWGVDESRLPVGSDVRFRSPGIWEQYSGQISLLAGVTLLQSLLIVGLLYEDHRRRAAEARHSVAEAQSARLKSEMAQLDKVAAAGQMSASIAHEIRQPLAAIVAFGTAGLRWLTRSEPDFSEVQKSLKTIVDQGLRAGQMIENVRALFKQDIEPRVVVDVRSLVRNTLVLVPEEIRSNNIIVKLNIDSVRPLQVFGNEGQLRQVLLNLITNAIDSMKSVANRPRVLRVTAAASEPRGVSIAVEDSGPGIDPKTLDRLFDPFFTTKPTGMGLGLSICKSIVEAHKGNLIVEAAGQYGAIFHIVLPDMARTQDDDDQDQQANALQSADRVRDR
ncbi:MAG: GHKL domain-containing protein [Alphaproteobacteria bacterium]|nr:MAG: GHKL domain-containing protein [Alphaproteobacteria bacterium]